MDIKPGVVSTLFCALFLSAAAAAALPPRAILFTERGHPLSSVPGRSDGLALSSFSISESSYSPNGRYWAVDAIGTDGRTVLLSGTPDGIVSVAVQNEVLPGLSFAYSFNPNSLAIGDNGDLAFATQVLGGSALDRVIVVRYAAADRVYAKAIRQNDVIPGLGLSVPGATGERYGSQLTVASVLRDGRIALVAKGTSGPLPTTRDEFLLLTGTPADSPVQVLAQVGVTVPVGQSGGGVAPMVNFERRGGVSNDGLRWLLRGQLGRTVAPNVTIVGGRVMIEQAVSVPGLTGTISVPETRMFGGGNWIARGTSTAGERYLIVDGELRVRSGAPAPGLAGLGLVERIDSAAINAHGDLAYAMSTTDGRAWIVIDPAFGAPFVAVSNLTQLEVRGSPRGPVFYGSTLSSDLGVGLQDDGTLYFFTRARDREDLTAGDGLFVIEQALWTMR